MASAESRSAARVREDIRAERDKLAEAVGELREELGEAADVAGKLRARLPLVAAGALGMGFVFAGGIGATARLLMRRSREGDTKAVVGRYKLVERE